MKRRGGSLTEAPRTRKRLCGKAPPEELLRRAQDALESAGAQRALADREARRQAEELEAEAQRQGARIWHGQAEERQRSAKAALDEALKRVEAAQRALEEAKQQASMRQQSADAACQELQEAKQQMEAGVQEGAARRRAAEELARQRASEEAAMKLKLRGLCSELGLSTKAEEGSEGLTRILEKSLSDAGRPLRTSMDAPPALKAAETEPEVAAKVATGGEQGAGSLTGAPAPDGAVVPDKAPAPDLAPAPDKAPADGSAHVVLVMEGGQFRVEPTFPVETAEERQQQLCVQLQETEQALEQRRGDLRAAKEAHVALAAQIREKQEAAKPVIRQLEQDVAKAKQAQEACAAEVAKVQQLQQSFEEMQDPEKVKPRAAKAKLSPLQQLGIEAQAVTSLVELLQKKKSKRSPKERKLLTLVQDTIKAQLKARHGLQERCAGDVRQRQEKVDAAQAAERKHAQEVETSQQQVAAKELSLKAAEEVLETARAALAEHEARMTRAGLLRFNSASAACCLCCEDVPARAAATLGCGHGWYCPTCVNRFVEARLEEGIAGDIPCPDCGKTISEDDLVRLLPKQTVFKLHASNISRKAVASGAVPRSCPTPDCPMEKTFDDGGSARETCPLCGEESCWWCGAQPYHEGLSCEEYRRKHNDDDQSFLQWMKATGTKQCPTCGMATTKENLEMQTDQVEECHKMICRSCGTKFCFGCEAVLTESFSCGCTQNAHNFVDPHTGKLVKHLKKGKAKPKAKARN
ncbi:unnamed protein product [Effrenium voratum]|uniref:RING-type domain-containing protein n=1 Tax=Effrenium voratum TaxID=2562239 RepID=A0AA36NCA8_9DINO|nr:unnamed protein product [Effrenium voratum]CAJ1432229.1 unnamed protein product [Effrenium voratum]